MNSRSLHLDFRARSRVVAGLVRQRREVRAFGGAMCSFLAAAIGRVRRVVARAALPCVLCLSGMCCDAPASPSQESAIATGEASAPEAERQVVLVSVATSAQGLMESLGAQFTRETGIEVKLNVGASSSLAHQIEAGAPARLFLSANRAWAERLASEGLALQSSDLLANDLVLVVPRGNPARVLTPADLTTERVQRVALAGERVPAGIYADQALEKLGLRQQLVDQRRVVRGQDVQNTLQFVARGEADAAIVYSTDALGRDEIEVVFRFDRHLHDEIVYVLVHLKATDEDRLPKIDTPSGNRALAERDHDATRQTPVQDDPARQLFEYLVSSERNSEYARWGFARYGAPRAESGFQPSGAER